MWHEIDNYGIPTGFYFCSFYGCDYSLAGEKGPVWETDVPSGDLMYGYGRRTMVLRKAEWHRVARVSP